MNDIQNALYVDYMRRPLFYQEEINKLIITNSLNMQRQATAQEVEHVHECIDSMVMDFCGKKPAGSFVRAVIANDLMMAFRLADDMNTRLLWVYCAFIYNFIPAPLVDERRKK